MKKNHYYMMLIALLSLCFTTSCSNEDDEPEAIAVAFTSLTANGSATETTTTLTLTFDKAIEGLTADDITLTAGTTGTTKGALTAKGSGVYEIGISGITSSMYIDVTVDKTGYTFSPKTNKIEVWYAKPVLITNTALITAIEKYTGKTFTKTAEGHVDIAVNKVLIEGITKLDLSEKQLTSLEGIEYFGKLQDLNCYKNKLTTLDVSKNTELTALNCSSNQLATLDVTQNTKLTALQCVDNILKTLDVSKNTELSVLNCYLNSIRALDVTSLSKLVKWVEPGVFGCGCQGIYGLVVSMTLTLTEAQNKDYVTKSWLDNVYNTSVILKVQ